MKLNTQPMIIFKNKFSSTYEHIFINFSLLHTRSQTCPPKSFIIKQIKSNTQQMSIALFSTTCSKFSSVVLTSINFIKSLHYNCWLLLSSICFLTCASMTFFPITLTSFSLAILTKSLSLVFS